MAFTPIDPNKAEVRITGAAPNYGLDFYIPRGERGEIGPQGPIGPTNPTNLTVGVVETGPETPGATGPQGLKGDKGDPGGLVTPTSITTQDLNSYITSGMWRQQNSADALTSRNYPIDNTTGVLTVKEHAVGSAVLQTYEPVWGTRATRVIYQRQLTSGTWTAWKSFSGSRVDQTAGRVIYEWDDVNGREQLTWGDTGMRTITSSVNLNGWTCSIASIRRVGQIVTFALYGINPTGQTNQIAYQIPSGFRPMSYGGNLGWPVRNGAGNYVQLAIDTSGNVLPDTATISCSLQMHIFTWTTSETWPTTLPGTASGTIPNT